MKPNVSEVFHLWFGILFTASAPILVGIYSGSAGLALVTAGCGAFILLSAKIRDLAELSLGPLRAKMKETIAEAAATIDQLREVTAAVATVVLSDLMAGIFMWGMSASKRFELHDELIENLRKIGVPPSQIDRAEAEWRKGVGVLYHNKLGHDLHGRARVAGMDDAQVKSCVSEFNSLLTRETRSASSPDVYEAFFKKHKLVAFDLEQWIADYRHFLKTNEVRRLSEFDD